MKSTHGQMAFDRADRYTEDGKMKCRKGKECNGRCIPKGHECNADTQGGGNFEARTGTMKRVAAGVKGLAQGAGLGLAAVGVAKGLQNLRSKRQAKASGTPAPAASPESGRQVALPSTPDRPMLSSKSTASGGGAIVPSAPAQMAIRVKPGKSSTKLSTQMIETAKATATAVKEGYQEGPNNPEGFKQAGRAAGKAAGKVYVKARKKLTGK